MKRVSVLIPAYRGGPGLKRLLQRVISDPYPEKEIIVVVDEPDEEAVALADKLCNVVRFILNEERVGKAEALNRAIKLSTGDVLLFMDADTEPGTERFIGTVMEELNGYDVLDVKKVVKAGNFLQKMVHYEYLGFNAASWILSRRLGRVPGINGACFAAKRELVEKVGGIPYTISEDLDLALKFVKAGGRFKYTTKAFVYTDAPRTWEGWVAQRKRWAIGLGRWVSSNLRSLLNEFLNSPIKYLTSIILLFPSLIAGAMAALFGEPLLLLLQISLLSSILPFTAGMRFFGIALAFSSIKGLAVYLLSLAFGFAAGCIAFKAFSRKLGYRFSSLEFLAYVLIYSPLWLAFALYGIAAAIAGREPKIDWVVKKPKEESLI